MGSEKDDIRAVCRSLSQDHLFRFEAIAPATNIENQLRGLNLSRVVQCFEQARSRTTQYLTEIEPVRNVPSVLNAPREDLERWRSLGVEAIQAGSVAVVIMSGGQGTRLGYDGPKGMYNIGLPSGKSMFQMHFERVMRVKHLCTKDDGQVPSVPIYVMTSELNDAVIREYLEQQNYFGFPKEDVILFEQGLLPCFDLEGKIILESAQSVAMAPDGNGGFFDALERQHVLPDMRRRGVQHLHVYGIDNMLTKSADPVFIGYCIHENAEAGNKVVWRAGPDERVGVIAKRAGRTQVVEYSELPTEMAALRDADGKLVFGAANIANHYFRVDFLEHTALPNLQLVYHIAKKKIPYVSEDGLSTVTPDDVNGYKLEMFIFDVFPLAERMATLEVAREEEFAPVKNANGTSVDSPDTARVLVSNLCKRWLRAAGAELVGYDIDELCEISPLLSYAGEGLEMFAGKEIELPCYLTEPK